MFCVESLEPSRSLAPWAPPPLAGGQIFHAVNAGGELLLGTVTAASQYMMQFWS